MPRTAPGVREPRPPSCYASGCRAARLRRPGSEKEATHATEVTAGGCAGSLEQTSPGTAQARTPPCARPTPGGPTVAPRTSSRPGLGRSLDQSGGGADARRASAGCARSFQQVGQSHLAATGRWQAEIMDSGGYVRAAHGVRSPVVQAALKGDGRCRHRRTPSFRPGSLHSRPGTGLYDDAIRCACCLVSRRHTSSRGAVML